MILHYYVDTPEDFRGEVIRTLENLRKTTANVAFVPKTQVGRAELAVRKRLLEDLISDMREAVLHPVEIRKADLVSGENGIELIDRLTGKPVSRGLGDSFTRDFGRPQACDVGRLAIYDAKLNMWSMV